MIKKIILVAGSLFLILVILDNVNPTTIPADPPFTANTSTLYGEESPVTINGYAGDVMEPFISKDGQILFFNSLNNGVDTSLYYAHAISETEFTFVGEIVGVNEESPHLDAVASKDQTDNFYWVSLRNYGESYENLQTGRWRDGRVTDITSVRGDFYIRKPGWLIMDAEVSSDGSELYFVNADFSHGEAIPKQTKLGVATKVGDEFIVEKNSTEILASINNKFNIAYAPSLSSDGLMIAFTRLVPGPETQMYIATRGNKSEPFGEPELLSIPGTLVEGSSFGPDGGTLYYHKKDSDGRYKIYIMKKSASAE